MIVELNVGGVFYSTYDSTLTSIPDSFFSKMFSGEWENKKDEHGRIFIDRNGDTFKYILGFLRDGPNVALPKDELSLTEIHLEAVFYCLEGLEQIINDRIIGDRIVTLHFGEDKQSAISLYEMRSSQGSYFADLATNITNNTVDRDKYATLAEDGSYHIDVGKIQLHRVTIDQRKKTEYIVWLCEILKYSESSNRVSAGNVDAFLAVAEVLGVQEGVKFVDEFRQKKLEKLNDERWNNSQRLWRDEIEKLRAEMNRLKAEVEELRTDRAPTNRQCRLM